MTVSHNYGRVAFHWGLDMGKPYNAPAGAACSITFFTDVLLNEQGVITSRQLSRLKHLILTTTSSWQRLPSMQVSRAFKGHES